MAKDCISINNGTNFISVQVEVSDNCVRAAKAIKRGLCTAAHKMGHAMPKLMDLAEMLETGDDSLSTAQSEWVIGDVTCVVRVRGRIEGGRPLLVAELFDEIASAVNRRTVHTAVGDSKQAAKDLHKLAGDTATKSGSLADVFAEMFTDVPGGFEDLVGADASTGGLNGFGSGFFGSNS